MNTSEIIGVYKGQGVATAGRSNFRAVFTRFRVVCIVGQGCAISTEETYLTVIPGTAFEMRPADGEIAIIENRHTWLHEISRAGKRIINRELPANPITLSVIDLGLQF